MFIISIDIISHILCKLISGLDSFQNQRAFPIDDVGLHNAIKVAYQLERKPTLDEIRARFEPWTGWEAYATFYLWRALM